MTFWNVSCTWVFFSYYDGSYLRKFTYSTDTRFKWEEVSKHLWARIVLKTFDASVPLLGGYTYSCCNTVYMLSTSLNSKVPAYCLLNVELIRYRSENVKLSDLCTYEATSEHIYYINLNMCGLATIFSCSFSSTFC